jgi:uncharacterized protein (DUF983 family)
MTAPDAAPHMSGPHAAPRPLDVAINGLCPQCAATTLFAGLARFADRCPACGLDFSRFNVGDGPAAFLTLILGAIVVALAITLELTVHPPLWLHMLIWIPFTAAGVVGSLRVAKGALMALEYRNAAREGRIQQERIGP